MTQNKSKFNTEMAGILRKQRNWTYDYGLKQMKYLRKHVCLWKRY